MWLNQGRNRNRDLIADDMDSGQYGTGTTAPQKTDNSLEIATSGTSKSLTLAKLDQQLIVDHNLSNVEGNGNVLTEFALKMDGGNTLATRNLVDGDSKDASKQFQTTILIFFK